MAVSVVLLPAHIDTSGPAFTVNGLDTVTTAVALSVQFPFAPVTIYICDAVGVAITVLPVLVFSVWAGCQV